PCGQPSATRVLGLTVVKWKTRFRWAVLPVASPLTSQRPGGVGLSAFSWALSCSISSRSLKYSSFLRKAPPGICALPSSTVPTTRTTTPEGNFLTRVGSSFGGGSAAPAGRPSPTTKLTRVQKGHPGRQRREGTPGPPSVAANRPGRVRSGPHPERDD